MFVRSYSTIDNNNKKEKNEIVHFNLNLMNTIVLFKQVHGKFSAHAIFRITIYRPPNARLNSNFKMSLDNSHNASLTLK